MYTRETQMEQEVERAAVRFVCDLFERNRTLSDGPVINEPEPTHLEELAARGIPAVGRPLEEVVREMERDVIGYGYNADHARFMGFVPGPTSAISWLGDMIAAGCRKFAFVNELPQNFYIRQNFIIWEKILKDYSLELDPDLIFWGPHKFSGIISTLQPVFMQDSIPFDGIIATDFRLAQEVSHLICARFGFQKEYPVKLGTLQQNSALNLPVTIFYARQEQKKQCQAAMKQLIGLMDNSGTPAIVTV